MSPYNEAQTTSARPKPYPRKKMADGRIHSAGFYAMVWRKYHGFTPSKRRLRRMLAKP